MHIVTAMAVDARRTGRVLSNRVCVTSFALERFMAVKQREIGVFAMIKRKLIPTGFPVAVRALLAVSARMNVIEAVAVDARFGGILIALVGMACATLHFLVLAFQGVIRIAMIKTSLGPGFRRVAIPAFVAQRAPVCIIILVTGFAGLRGLTIFIILYVAGAT